MEKKILAICSCLAMLVFQGCETESGNKSLGTKANNVTSNLNGQELISYMFQNKDAKLNASDCMKFSAQDWDNIYRDVIYEMAPATAMAKSIYSCRSVKRTVEYGYSLERASREHIKQGWLNGIVTEYDYTQQNGYQRINLTLQKCKTLYDGFSQSQWAQETGYGDDKPVAMACYQALVAGPALGIDGQNYIDAYNNGVYDGLVNVNNFDEDSQIDNNNESPYQTIQEEEQQLISVAQSFTWDDCNDAFGDMTSDQMSYEILDSLEEGSKLGLTQVEISSYKVYIAGLTHCRYMLYGD